MTRKDFSTEKRASGWAVVRSDSATLAIGFPSKSDAAEFLRKELDALGLPA